MILLEKGGRRYRCSSAFIASLHDEQRLCSVSSKQEVVAFLVQHPDRYYFLIHDSTIEQGEEPDAERAIFCGLVKFVSKDAVLVNKRFSFAS
jgi:hypothetical protein